MEIMTLVIVSVLVLSILSFALFVQARSQAAGRKGERRLATLGVLSFGFVALSMGILLVNQGTEATRAGEAFAMQDARALCAEVEGVLADAEARWRAAATGDAEGWAAVEARAAELRARCAEGPAAAGPVWLAWLFAVILGGGLLLGGTVVVRSARAEAAALRDGTEKPARGPLLVQGLISVILVTVGVVGLIQF
jgi:hypothetical protein